MTAGGRIEFVGPVADVPGEIRGRAVVVDLAGRPLFPGFCDGHTHLVLAAEQLAALDLLGTGSVEELQERLRGEAGKRRAGDWIAGFGWELKTLFPDQPPALRVLDAAAPDNPVFLMSKDAHSAWLNSRAVEFLDRLDTLPSKCAVQTVDGTRTGLIFEDTFQLKQRLVAELTRREKIDLLGPTVENFLERGITAVHNFEGVDEYRLLNDAYRKMPRRLRTVWSFAFRDPDELMENMGMFRVEIPDWLIPGWVKLFLDGSLGSRTAALSKPYVGTGDTGLLTMTAAELDEWVRTLARQGLSGAFHAIGDRAVEMVLTSLRKHAPGTGGHRIEHAQILSKRIYDTCSFSGLIFSVQPSHMWGDREIVETKLRRKTGERYAYPYRTISRLGGQLIFGSDNPIETPDPWKGIQAAVTRLAGPGISPWNPDEAVGLYDAILAHTGSLTGLDRRLFETGALKPGSPADLVVFNEDPFAVLKADPAGLYGRIKPDLTMVNGEIVYQI